ncbi:response regulator [Pseudomonadales bacterium]|nr:response regulator [Pseudomonadales bacterium]
MYGQDLNLTCQSLAKKNKRLNIVGFAFIFFLSLVFFLFSNNARATENNLFASTAILQLDSSKPTKPVKQFNTLLHSYLEINASGETPTINEATSTRSPFWQSLAGKSKAISGNAKAHWFRLYINNPSDQVQHYVFSIAPIRSLFVRTAVLNHVNDADNQASFTTPPLTIKKIHDRNINQTEKIEINLTFAAHESKILLFSMTSDIWTIPHFDLQAQKQLTVETKQVKHYWQLINGILICMMFFILSAAIITKQSALLWLPMYSISTICFIPNYLIYNLKSLDLNAALINTLNIDSSLVSLIAFIGILKYIFYDNALLQKVSHSKLLLALGFLIVITTIIQPPNIGAFIYTSQSIEILVSIVLSIVAFRHKHPIAACLVGPAKLIVLTLIVVALYYARLSVLSQLTFHVWLASVILLDAAILTIILLLVDRDRREQRLYKLISVAKKEQQVAAISPLLGKNRHDLRASLSDIIGLSDLIIATPLDQEQRKNILDIQQSGRQGLEKINQIFSYKDTNPSRLESQEPFTLSTLLSECAQYYSYRADELSKEIIIDISEETPKYWRGNHEQIRQLFMHILEYYLSNDDFFEIRIEVSHPKNNSISVLFAINTNSNTFNNPSKINSKLATANLIAKKLSGELQLKSNYNSLLITTELLATPTVDHSNQQLDLELLKNRRIIIIDDNETSCNVIGSYLQRWHITIFKSNNFNDALAIIRHQANIDQPIDLALIDFIMPNISGIEASKRLRSDTDIPDNLSIIIMSNTTSSINSVDIKNCGIKQLLDKPVLADTLKLVLLEEFYLLRSLASEGITKQKKAIANKKLLLVEDNPISAKIVFSMLKKLSIDFEYVSNGHDALNKFKSETFDIILMDCELPAESGFEVTRKIRAYEKLGRADKKPCSIIALTAYDDDDSRVNSIEAGMNDYLAKPINLIQLTTLMNKDFKH